MKRTRIGALLIGAGPLVAACTGGSASPTAGEPTTAPASGEPSDRPGHGGRSAEAGWHARRVAAG